MLRSKLSYPVNQLLNSLQLKSQTDFLEQVLFINKAIIRFGVLVSPKVDILFRYSIPCNNLSTGHHRLPCKAKTSTFAFAEGWASAAGPLMKALNHSAFALEQPQ